MGHRLAAFALLLTFVSCGDNNHPSGGALLVSPQLGLFTDESGTAATFTVALSAPPSERTVVTVTTQNAAEGSVSPSSLIFEPSNYAQPQTVTVTGVDDAIDDGDTPFVVSVASAPLAAMVDVAVTNGDDDVSGVKVSPVIGLMTSETGTQATFTVELTAQPALEVVIPISTTDATEGTANKTSLTFTSANYGPQTVTVTGVDDSVVDGDVTYSISLGAAVSSDAHYHGFDPDDVQLVNVDSETTGIVVSPTSGLQVSETATTATFTVVLSTQPTADVTIAIVSSDVTEATVSTAALVFTTANWNVAKTVTVTGVNDVLDDGDIAWTIVTGAAVSTDGAYSGVNASDVTGTTLDNDGAGVTVTPTSGLQVSEAMTTATFMVVLQSQPTADVTIPVMSSDTTEATVSSSSLVFTTANWNVAKTVTVTGVDDALDDGDIAWTIVLGAATSSDSMYSGFNPADVTGTTIDNDGPPGFVVTPTSGLITTEAGGTATFSVTLTAAPTANVTVSVMSSDATEASVSTGSLVFTTANWNMAHVVTVTGIDDFLDDGDIAFTIVLGAAVSTDGAYSGLNPTDVTGTNTDNDSVGFTVTPTSGLVTTEFAGTATFTVRLNSQPSATVTTAITSSDTTEGTVSPPSLTFDSSNWNVLRTVTVTGVEDVLVDGNIAYTIVLAAATSADGQYSGMNPPDVSVTNNDNDSVNFIFDQTSLTTSELKTADAFTLRLGTAPTANVTIPISSNDTTEGTVSVSSLTFTPANWMTPQQVTVTGVDDALFDGNITFAIVTGAATSTDSTYSGANPADVTVVNEDNDRADVEVKTTGSLVVSESGTTYTIKVRLPFAPTANVTCTLFSTKPGEGSPSPTTLTFTPANFGYQSVVVTGVDDQVVDGDQNFTIVMVPCTSTDLAYNGSNPRDVIMQNKDND